MRQYAWYSPEFNIICLQTIIEGCWIKFEFDWRDSFIIGSDPISKTSWIPLGEL